MELVSKFTAETPFLLSALMSSIGADEKKLSTAFSDL
jgi:hypothetical protein